MTQRQQLAVTLRNYCKKENNVKHLLDEGAVVALCGLAGLDDDRIRCAVAVALSNLTKRGDYIDALLKAGVMVAVLLSHGSTGGDGARQAILKRRREYGIADPAPGSEERRRETAGLRAALHCARTLANMPFCQGRRRGHGRRRRRARLSLDAGPRPQVCGECVCPSLVSI